MNLPLSLTRSSRSNWTTAVTSDSSISVPGQPVFSGQQKARYETFSRAMRGLSCCLARFPSSNRPLINHRRSGALDSLSRCPMIGHVSQSSLDLGGNACRRMCPAIGKFRDAAPRVQYSECRRNSRRIEWDRGFFAARQTHPRCEMRCLP